MSRYSEHSTYELSAIFDKRECLTLASQIELRDEFAERNGDEELIALNAIINSKIGEIANFSNLKDLGFKVIIDDEMIQVLRTTWAKIWDVGSIFVGLVLVCLGIIGLAGIIAEFGSNAEFNLVTAGLKIFLTVLGVSGIKMLSGFNRLLDYHNFKLIAYSEEIVLHKLSSNLKTTVRKVKVSDLQLVSDSDELVMKIGEEIIIKGNSSNFTQKTTMIELLNRIKSL